MGLRISSQLLIHKVLWMIFKKPKCSLTSFTAVKIVWCLFYLGENLWRNVQQLNLVNDYKNDENVRTHVKMALAPTFAPPADVAAVSFVSPADVAAVSFVPPC